MVVSISGCNGGAIKNLIGMSSFFIFDFIDSAICFCTNISTTQIQLGGFQCFEREIPSLQTTFLRPIHTDASATGSTYVLQMIFQAVPWVLQRGCSFFVAVAFRAFSHIFSPLVGYISGM